MEGIIFIGLQGSGKSSFYLEKFYKSHLRLNLDMLRTRNRESILFNACLESKQPVVIDNTNPEITDRERYIPLLKKHRFAIVGYYFESKLADCLIRNGLREGKECIPEVGVRSTYRKLQRPSYQEGFDQLFYVCLRGNKFLVTEWKDEVQ